MKSQSLLTLFLSLLAVSLLAAGCAENPVAGEPTARLTMDQMDLDLAYGGLAYTDEAPAFGDAALLHEAVAEETAVADAEVEADVLRDVPLLRDAPERELVRTYVRIVWGNLEGERPPTDPVPPTDDYVTWDGSLTVSEGNALVLRTTILFERPFDHLLPREDRQTLAWHSTTKPHVDGVLVCILSRANLDGSIEGELTFQTPLLTQTFALSELAGLDVSVPVDELGNGVSFLGFSAFPADTCPRGFLGGHWRSNPETDGGIFAGRMVTASGRLIGYMQGRYGVNTAGERVFAGKVIGRDGRIRGLMQGEWQPSAEQDGGGSFVGHWAGRAQEHKGTLRGRYQSHPERPGGTFGGVWEEVCENVDGAA